MFSSYQNKTKLFSLPYNLIRSSMMMLETVANKDRKKIFNINFPGIGNGGLKRAQVKSLLRDLPDIRMGEYVVVAGMNSWYRSPLFRATVLSQKR
jgi:hypothetical protein